MVDELRGEGKFADDPEVQSRGIDGVMAPAVLCELGSSGLPRRGSQSAFGQYVNRLDLKCKHTHKIRMKVSSNSRLLVIVSRIYHRANAKIEPMIVGAIFPTRIWGTRD